MTFFFKKNGQKDVPYSKEILRIRFPKETHIKFIYVYKKHEIEIVVYNILNIFIVRFWDIYVHIQAF